MDRRGTIHRVQYYETDRMGIVHHSNYFRWMEEVRVDYLSRIGLPYDRLEAEGIISPVISAECSYKLPTRFGDTVEITACLQAYRGVRFTMEYEMRDYTSGQLVACGTTEHCFVNGEGRPISIKRTRPELYERLQSLIGINIYQQEDE